MKIKYSKIFMDNPHHIIKDKRYKAIIAMVKVKTLALEPLSSTTGAGVSPSETGSTTSSQALVSSLY